MRTNRSTTIIVCLAVLLAGSTLPAAQQLCSSRVVRTIGNVDVRQLNDVRQVEDVQGLFYVSGLMIDADGAPNAYHPDDTPGLDHLANAGHPGDWWGICVDKNGRPLIQGQSDPYPGFYVSVTALEDQTYPECDPRRYVDSTKIPFIALPPVEPFKRPRVRLGDLAFVINTADGRASSAIFADIGPGDKLGEGSIALAERLSIPSSPRNGGTDSGVFYVVFPGSGDGKPLPLDEIDRRGKELFEKWGGMSQFKACTEN